MTTHGPLLRDVFPPRPRSGPWLKRPSVYTLPTIAQHAKLTQDLLGSARANRQSTKDHGWLAEAGECCTLAARIPARTGDDLMHKAMVLQQQLRSLPGSDFGYWALIASLVADITRGGWTHTDGSAQ